MITDNIQLVLQDLTESNLTNLIRVITSMNSLHDGFKHYDLEVPEWLTDGLEAVDCEIKIRRQAERRSLLKTLKNSLKEALPRAEKREALEEEILDLESKLKQNHKQEG